MKEKKMGYSVLVIILFAAVCFLTVYIIINRKAGSDCSVTNNSNDITNTNEKNYKNPIVDLSYINDKPILKINDNKVELNENSWWVSNLTIIDDMVIFKQSDPGSWIITIVDSNGNIIKEISHNDVLGNGLSNYEVKNNNIYITSNLLAQDDIAVTCNQKRENKNEDVVFTEKMEYLGEGNFSNLTLEKTIKTNEYIETKNITCEQ